MAEPQLDVVLVECPECMGLIRVPLSISAEQADRMRSGAAELAVTVDRQPLVDHVRDEHPHLAARVAATVDRHTPEG